MMDMREKRVAPHHITIVFSVAFYKSANTIKRGIDSSIPGYLAGERGKVRGKYHHG